MLRDHLFNPSSCASALRRAIERHDLCVQRVRLGAFIVLLIQLSMSLLVQLRAQAQVIAQEPCLIFDLDVSQASLSAVDKEKLSAWYIHEVKQLTRCESLIGSARDQALKTNGVYLEVKTLNALSARKLIRHMSVRAYLTAYVVTQADGTFRIGALLDSELRRGPDIGAGAWVASHHQSLPKRAKLSQIKRALSRLIAKINDADQDLVSTQHALRSSPDQMRATLPQDHPQPEILKLALSASPDSASDLLHRLRNNYTFISKNYQALGGLKLGVRFQELTGDAQWTLDHLSQPKLIKLERRFSLGSPDAHYLFGSMISKIKLWFLDQRLAQIEVILSLKDERGRYDAKLDRKIISNFKSIYQKLGYPPLTMTPLTYLDEAYQAESETRDLILRRYLTRYERGSWINQRYAAHIDRELSHERQDLVNPSSVQTTARDEIKISLIKRSAQASLKQLKLELTRHQARRKHQDWYQNLKAQTPRAICPNPLSCLMRGLEAREFRHYDRAAFFFDTACQRGELKGCVSLGVLYFYGRGVARDTRRARQLYQKACRGGHVVGCTNLGVMYESGSGVKRNHRRAVKLYTEACQKGYGRACGNLGVIYYAEGQRTKGALYDARACEEGDDRGCHHLGYSYEYGAGVQVNLAKAHIFYTKACRGGYQEACASLSRLARRSLPNPTKLTAGQSAP